MDNLIPKLGIMTDLDGALGSTPFQNSENVFYSDEVKLRGWTEMTPFPRAVPIINTLAHFFDITINTGRDERLGRRVTERWLRNNEFRYRDLVMIPQPWTTYKQYLHFKSELVRVLTPALVIDDDEGICRYVKENFPAIPIYRIKSNTDWNFCKIVERMTALK